MATCLVLSDQELKSYNDLGVSTHEVQRDYLEYGELRSPMAIKYKLNLENERIPELPADKTEFDEFASEAEDFDKKSAESWIYKLNKALGVEAQVISRQEAEDIHAAKGYEYDGENAFFTDGKAYFVEGTLTPESVVHEFSHPLIKSLDPTLKQKLYNDLLNDPDLNGQAIVDEVADKYGEEFDKERAQEEVLVRALTKMTAQEQNTPSVDTWLGKILYNIRQALRKLLGRKVNVRNLDGNTTLKDLANMLAQGDVAELQKDLITSSDVIDYFKDRQKFVDEFETLLNEGNKQGYAIAENMINQTMDIALRQKKDVINNPEFFSLRDVLLLEYGENNRGLLDEIINDLRGQATLDRKNVVKSIVENDNYTPTVETIRERLLNLSKSLHKVDEIFDTMMNFAENKDGTLKALGTEGQLASLEGMDSKDKIDRLLYYKKFMMEWTGRFGEDPLESTGVIDTFVQISRGYPETHPLRKLAKKLEFKAKEISDKINELQRQGVAEYMYEIMIPTADNAVKDFNEEVAKRKKRNTPQRIIDRMYRDFHNMTEQQYNEFKELQEKGIKNQKFRRLEQLWFLSNELNREKIDAMLDGRTGDAQLMEGMYESVSMNPDAQIQSVYKYMQKVKNQYEGQVQKFYNDFVQAVSPHIDKVGGKFQNRGALGKKMGFKDTKGIKNPATGEVEQVEEWVFLNPWKNFRYDKEVYEQNIEDLAQEYRDTNSEADRIALLEAKREYQEWQNKYMHQDFTVEYYKTKDLLTKDDIGREADKRRQEIFTEINQFLEDNEEGQYDDVIRQLRYQLKELSSTTDMLGRKKTGMDLKVAERLQEYSEARAKFFEEDEMPGEFQREYNEYSKYLTEFKNLDIESDAYKAKMEDWLRRNTRVVLKNSVFEKRKALIEEKQQILRLLNEENKKIFDDTEYQNVINEQSRIIRDNGNQPEGDKATEEARKKVLEAHEKIEEKRKDLITRSGLTKADNERLKELRKIWKDNGKRFPKKELQEEFTALTEKQAETSARLGLNEITLKRLKEIDSQLRNMGGKIPTDYYKNVMIELIRKAGGEQSFISFVETEDIKVSSMEEAYNQDFEAFINSQEGKDLMESNDEFKEFVEQNHYDSEGEMKATNLWYTSVSEDPYDYRTKRLRDANGKDLGLIEIDDTFRIPASRFYVRKVKDQYRTKKVVGETVDNKGKWLPKEESTNRYRNHEYYDLKEQDPDTFAFMEEIKKHYLKAQENNAEKDKLYLSYPRTRKTRTENVFTGNVMRWQRRVREWTRGSEDDVFELKYESKKMAEDKDALGVISAISTGVGVPVMGVTENDNFKQRMHIDDISTDILKTIPEYMASSFQKQAALEANSYSRSMQDIVNRTKVDDRNLTNNAKTLVKKSYSSDIPDQFSKKNPQDTNRKKVLDALVERELDGVYLTGKTKLEQTIAFQKTLSAMTSRASKINFNWNVFSGIVNYGQMKITSITHAVAGDYFTILDGAKGEMWAMRAASKISTNIHKKGKVKPIEEQLIMLFDAIQGRATETIGDSLSRTIIGDAIEGKSPQKLRKWLEMEGTIQNFGALMYNKKVKITDKNGNVREIPYINAFEIVDGNIQTKEGVEADYAVTYDADGNIQFGDKFVEHKEHMQNVIMQINGAFSKADTPLIARNVFMKQMLYLKKHVIPLFIKTYQFSSGMNEHGGYQMRKRMNWATGKAGYGYQIQTIRYMRDFVESLLRDGHFLRWTNSERTAFLFTAVQVIIGQYILKMLYGMFTPWDDEEDRPDYAAMKDRSGYYEAPFTVDQDTYFFQAKGYIMNSMSYITRKLTDEYNAVNIFTPTGAIEYMNHGTSQSVGAVQSLKFFKDVLNMLTGDKNSVPKQTTGPYWFQQKDAAYMLGEEWDEERDIIIDPGTPIGGKWFELVFDFVGQNTKIIDPVNTQRAYEAGQRMK